MAKTKKKAAKKINRVGKKNKETFPKLRRGFVYSHAEKISLLNKFFKVYTEGGRMTLKSAFSSVGGCLRTVSEWLAQEQREKLLNPNLETPVSDIYNQAKKIATENYREEVVHIAKNSLERLIVGESVKETSEEQQFRRGILVGEVKKTVNKIFQPNATAVIFALKTQDRENFTESSNINLGLSDNGNISSIKFQIKSKGV